MLQHRIIKFEKTFYTEFVGKGLPYVVVCGLLVDADYPISALAVETPSSFRSSSCLIWPMFFVFPVMVVYCMLDFFYIQ